MEEDWDAEIAGTCEPKYNNQSPYVPPESDTNRGYSNYRSVGQNSENSSFSRGKGVWKSAEETREAPSHGYGRGRGRSDVFDRRKEDRGRRGRGSESQNWRNTSAQDGEEKRSESRTFTKYGEEKRLSVESQFVGRIIGLCLCCMLVIRKHNRKNKDSIC